MALFPTTVVGLLFGQSFKEAEPLLSLYALATGFYALSVVLMTYEMSRKIANTGWLQLVFSGAMVLVIGIFHESLLQVVMVQLIIMTFLLIAVSLPFARQFLKRTAPVREEAA
jgi:hypothetical membrane protein